MTVNLSKDSKIQDTEGIDYNVTVLYRSVLCRTCNPHSLLTCMPGIHVGFCNSASLAIRRSQRIAAVLDDMLSGDAS